MAFLVTPECIKLSKKVYSKLKHVYYLGWNRSPAQVGCMRQGLGPGVLGRPRGSGWRGRWEGGSGWGTHVNPWLFHFNVWQNSLKKKKKKVYSRETSQKVFQFSLSNKNSTWQLVLSLLTVVLTCYCWLLLSCLLGHFLKYVMWKLCHPEVRLYKVSPGIVADYKQMRLFLLRLLQRHQNSLPQMQKI